MGYKVFLKNRKCIILDKFPSNQLIAAIKMTSNRMFPLKIKPDLNLEYAQTLSTVNSQEDKEKGAAITQTIFQAEIKDENCLWHLCLGHLNFGGLNLLHRENMVRGFPLIEKATRVWIHFGKTT